MSAMIRLACSCDMGGGDVDGAGCCGLAIVAVAVATREVRGGGFALNWERHSCIRWLFLPQFRQLRSLRRRVHSSFGTFFCSSWRRSFACVDIRPISIASGSLGGSTAVGAMVVYVVWVTIAGILELVCFASFKLASSSQVRHIMSSIAEGI